MNIIIEIKTLTDSRSLSLLFLFTGRPIGTDNDFIFADGINRMRRR